MGSVFDLKRTGIFWWCLLTALVFIIPGPWLVAAAAVLRHADWLQPNKPPVIWLSDFRQGVDAFATSFPGIIQFKPQEELVVVGPLRIANLLVGIVVGGVLIGLAFFFYIRAANHGGILDDLFAMVLIYFVLRVEGAATAAIPFVDYLNKHAPQSYLVVLLGFMILQILRGRGSRDSAIFFKLLVESILIGILILPRLTLDALAAFLEWPTLFQTYLAASQYYPMIMAVWALLGIVIVIVNLYNVGRYGAPLLAAPPVSGARRSGR